MKFNKQIATILVLTSLLLSALGAAYYFYMQNQQSIVKNTQLRTIYVAAKDIKKNKKITKDDLKKTTIAKKYILSTPLLKKEIINKIAKDNIYKNEMFRKEKLIIKIDNKESDLMKYKNNSYNIKFSLFSNPNYSLHKGDIINIVSVYPLSLKRENLNYDVQYIAKNIKIIGFLEQGKIVQNCFRTVRQKVKTKKKSKKAQYEMVTKLADELVLDIPNTTILKLIEDYNKGKQLWMVKTKLSKKKQIISKVNKPKKQNKVNYKVRWYIPKKTIIKQSATIHYADTNTIEKSHKSVISSNMKNMCQKRDKLLIGISRDVYLRQSISTKAKVIQKVHKNYVIPFIRKINTNWYEICDGSYVHKNEVRPISVKKANKKFQ